MFKDYKEKINALKKQNLYRNLVNSEAIDSTKIKYNLKKVISFASNDYMGLTQSNILKKTAISAIKKYGVGAGASRFVSGNNQLYGKLENLIAEFYQMPKALVFSSGYMTALGVVKALASKDDIIIADKLIHACFIDAAKISEAKFCRFQHNSIKHCNEILQENRDLHRNCLIIIESVYSMDGDVSNIEEFIMLAQKFRAILIIDNAHGLDCKFSSSPNLLLMGTLSKTIGALGGFVAGNTVLIENILQFSRSLIYSTALPPAILASAIRSFQYLRKTKNSTKAIKNAEYFCELMGLKKPDSQIIKIIIGDNAKLLKIQKEILKKGFLVSAIRSPTVMIKSERLRISFQSEHKKSQIKKLSIVIKKILADFKIDIS